MMKLEIAGEQEKREKPVVLSLEYCGDAIRVKATKGEDYQYLLGITPTGTYYTAYLNKDIAARMGIQLDNAGSIKMS